MKNFTCHTKNLKIFYIVNGESILSYGFINFSLLITYVHVTIVTKIVT